MSIDNKDGIFQIRKYLDALEQAYNELEGLDPVTRADDFKPSATVTVEVSREEAVKLYNARIEEMKERLREYGFTGPIKRVDR